MRAEILIALNRGGEAARLLDRLLNSKETLTADERVCNGLSLASALAWAGDYARSAQAANGVVLATSRRGWSLDRARAYRLIAEAEEAQGRYKEALAQAEHAHGALAANWWSQYLWGQGQDQSRFARFLGGPLGRLFTEHSRTEITYRRIQAEVPGGDSALPDG